MSQQSGAFAKQLRNVARESRFPPCAPIAEDVQSMAAGSTASWDHVGDDSDGLQLPPADLKLSRDGQQEANRATAPVNQAVQGLLNHDNENPTARRLRKAQEAAARKGRKRFTWGHMGGGVHNPTNTKLPHYIAQVGSGEGERSVLIMDARDQRLQSPYQGWLLDEILVNAHANVNTLADRHAARSPSSGYHLNLFYNKTLDGMKLIIAASMTSYGSVPCGRWDSDMAQVLSHEAFQPFRWPMMREDSPTWVDLKVKIEGVLILHLELRGYRSDADMTVQVNHVSDVVAHTLENSVFIPTFVVTIFQGYRVIATSWEVGGRLYAGSDRGVVVALDYPLCHFELRFVASASPDAMGNDADKLEFRFLSASDRLDVRCSTCSVPPSWLVVSRVSGPTLINSAKWCREHYARVEAPDQALQMNQLAAIHAHWTASTEAPTEEETGPRISAVAVESNAANFHLVCESPLFRKERAQVKIEALALQQHDPKSEVKIEVVPPIMDGPSVQPVARVSAEIKAIAGTPSEISLAAKPVSEAELSVMQPGEAPEPGSLLQSNALAPGRRSLAQRRGEGLDQSAWTPQAFVQEVRRVQGEGRPDHRDVQARVEDAELEIHMLGLSSLDGSGPVSYGPENPPK